MFHTSQQSDLTLASLAEALHPRLASQLPPPAVRPASHQSSAQPAIHQCSPHRHVRHHDQVTFGACHEDEHELPLLLEHEATKTLGGGAGDVVLDADFEILDVICIKLAANGDGDDKLQVKDGSDNAITDDMVTGGLGAAGRIKRAANIIPTYGSLSKGATLRFTQKKNAGNNAVRVVVIGVKS